MQEKEKTAAKKAKIVDMASVKSVHFVGIGGCGMSAIAKILFKKGYKISGSDIKESANTIRLREMGARIFIGHNKANIRGADLTVFSSAIPQKNVEIEGSQQTGIPIEKRAYMLSWIMDQFNVRIAVSGTHGKTTTTSMISSVLKSCGKDPTFLIGGEANDVDGNARLGNSAYVVAEADESDGSFLTLHPNVAVITNIESDHMEYFGTFEKVVDSFLSFAKLVPADGTLIVGKNGKGTEAILGENSRNNIITYGLAEGTDYWADQFKFNARSARFIVHKGKIKLGEVSLSIPGKQNIENALAAIAVADNLGCDFSSICNGLQSFSGAKRRFQILGEINNILVIDDYGHHPTEVARTLESARLGYPDKRIICIFQPHRFTRTFHLFEEFGKAFQYADIVIITDIYSAGEAPIEGISGRTIYDEVAKHNKNVIYVLKKEHITDQILEISKPNDLIITMGAGDISNSGKEIVNRLKICAGEK